MDIEAVRAAYRRYAGVYDAVFGPILHPGRKHIIEALNCKPGDRILDVAVGTGLSLPLYPKDVTVTGIDISEEMLDKARRRVERLKLSQVEAVLEMDAEDLRFKEKSFDKVVAMYVVSVVPNPERLVDEMRRVCKVEGDLFIVNHFRARNPVMRTIETLLAPLSKLVGFRPDLAVEDFLEATGLDVVAVHRANLFGYWKVLHCRNSVREAIAA